MKSKLKFRRLLLLIFPIIVGVFLVMTPAPAAEISAPNPEVERQTANALLDAGIKLRKNKRGDVRKEIGNVATSLARLGRTGTALKVANWLPSDQNLSDKVREIAAERSLALHNTEIAEELASKIHDPKRKVKVLLNTAAEYLLLNNSSAAQKVLLQAIPAIPDDALPDSLNLTAQAAYLLAKIGKRDQAKHLFQRAENEVSSYSYDSDSDAYDKYRLGRQLMPDILGGYLLRSGFIDEWKKFHNSISTPGTRLGLDVPTALLDIRRIDLFIDTIKSLSVENRMNSLIVAMSRTLTQSSQYPEFTESLFDSAENFAPDIVETKADGKVGIFEPKIMFLLLLSSGYDAINQEDKSQRWLRAAENEVSTNERPLVALYRDIWLTARIHGKKSTFSTEDLARINKEIKRYLPKMRSTSGSIKILSPLVRIQVAKGQNKSALANLKVLEELSFENIRQDDSPFIAPFYVLDVAHMYKQIGEDQRHDEILSKLIPISSEKDTYTAIDLLDRFAAFGHINSALRFYNEMPESKENSPQSALSFLPTALARRHPNQFPSEYLTSTDPAEEIGYLRDFERELTGKLSGYDSVGSLISRQ